MDEILCDVIQDLLPLYCDGVCSEESKKLVESIFATARPAPTCCNG